MKYTKEQFEKLPKWAQTHINSLTSDLKSAQNVISQYNGEQETNTYISDLMDKKPLPKDSCIQFKVGENQRENVSVRIDRYGDIDVNTDSRSGKTMTIIPRAANAFVIKFVNI